MKQLPQELNKVTLLWASLWAELRRHHIRVFRASLYRL
jgi:hypothetical protein